MFRIQHLKWLGFCLGILLLLSGFYPRPADQTVSSTASIALLTNPELPTFYASSALQEEIEVDQSFAPSGMYFVLQRDNRTGALLLSRSQILENNQEDAIGWVAPGAVYEWRDRRCAEPNWQLEAVEARREAGWRAMVFENPWAARSYMNKDTIGAVLWDKDLYDQRFSPAIFRLILAPAQKGDLLEVFVPRKSKTGLGYFTRGFAPNKFTELPAPIFAQTVLIEKHELESLILYLRQIRQALIDGESPELQEAPPVIVSLLFARRHLNQCPWPGKMQEIADVFRLSDKKREELLECVRDKITYLQDYLSDRDNQFRLYDRSFYWLPEEELP